MNKKGFTLVEIIVCITLIVLIGGSTTAVVIQKSTENADYFNKIVDAALVYISTEKDDVGNTYEVGINKGGEGVIIPLKELYTRGYLEQKDYDIVVKKLGNQEFVVVGYKNDEDCKTGGMSVSASWVDKTTYICGFSYSGPQSPQDNGSLYSKIVNLDYSTNCDKSEASSLCLLSSIKNDISDPNEDGTYDDVYYFKGKDVNNYLKIQGLEDTFRIVRTTENQNIKIVDNSVQQTKVNVYKINARYIEMDGFKIKSIRDDYIDYSCSNENNVSSWNDSKEVECDFITARNGLTYENTTTQSPIYLHIYVPLLNRYNSIKESIEQYIDTEYRWCNAQNTKSEISSKSFKCANNKTLNSKFGILNVFEYEIIQNIISNKQYFYSNLLSEWSCSDDDEIAFDNYPERDLITNNSVNRFFSDTFKIHPEYGRHCLTYENKKNLRAAYVIKGNSKVIGGTGTETDPYVIDGFVS